MAFEAGSVFAVLGGKFNPAGFAQFDGAMKKSHGNVNQFESALLRSTSRGSTALRALGTAAGFGAAGGVAALGVATIKTVQTAGQFEKAMRNVNSIAGLSETQFKKLSKGVLELSGKTAQSPQTLAQGMYQLVSSGFDAADSLKILKSSAVAATAGLTTTETATTAVAAVLNAYHLKASQAGKVSDTLFQTVNRGVITFDQLSQTIGTVLPFASNLHIGLGQVGASLSTLTKQGIPAAEATTYLKNAMVTFLKPQKDLQAAIKATGASSGEALIKQKGFQGALEAVIGTTDGTKSAIQKLFPDIRASAAAFALSGKSAKMAEADVRAFKNTTGATKKVFDEQSKSAAFAGQKLKSSFAAAQVIVGSQLLPILAEQAGKLTAKLQQMAANGQLAHIGQEMAHGFTTALHIGQQLGQVFIGMAHAGAPVVAVVHALASALSVVPTQAWGGALMGIVTALGAMKIAAVVAPMLSAVATGIDLVAAAAATGELAALPGLFLAAANPIGLIVTASAAAGAGLAILATRESDAEQAARAAAAAKRDLASAIRDLTGAEDDAAGKKIDADQAKIDLKSAQARVAATRGTKDHAQALVDLRRAKLNVTKASEAQNTADDALFKKQDKARDDVSRRVNAARTELEIAKQQAQARQIGAGKGARVVGPTPESLANLAVKQRDYNNALAESAVAANRAAISQLNAQRLAAGKSRISAGNQAGVAQFMRATSGLPKSITTKILMSGDQKAVSQLGKVALSLNGIVPTKRIQTILSGADSAREALAGLRAEANRQDTKVINAILRGGGTARQQLAWLRALKIPNKQFTVQAVKLGPFNFDVVVTKTIKTKGGNATGAVAGMAKTDGDGLALIGEGRNPREAVINSKTGDGYFTTGPMLDRLGPNDYVIPTDGQYRGRALGLFGLLAQDLGVPGYAAGTKPKGKGKTPSFPVPKKYQHMALSAPLDELQSKSDTAKSKYEAIKAKEKGKRKGLGAAKSKYEAAHKKYLEAKQFADAIAKQEDLIDIAEHDISIGSKSGDAKLYNKGVDSRKTSLGSLIKWLTKAVGLAPKGSAWQRELKKKLGEKQDALLDAGSGDYLTGKEQKNLGAAEALASQAELTPELTDDQAALGSIEQLRQSIYDRVLAAGAPSTVIKDAADALKQSRDDLAGLTSNTSPDTQALLDQANERARVAEKNSDINSKALAAFGGSGDIGTGGPNAYRAAGGGPSITINTLHPGDPSTLRAVAGAAVAGIDQQGNVNTSRVKTGI